MGVINPKIRCVKQFGGLKYDLQSFSTNTISLTQVMDSQYVSEPTASNIRNIFYLLQLQYNIDLEVDKFEFSIVIILFNKNSLESKLESIFSLLTPIGVLQFEEFYWIVQSLLRATSKINLQQIPSFEMILKCTQKIYQQMRKDLDQSLMLIELIDFVKSNSEVSEFLLRFYRIQTYENAIRQQEQILKTYLQIFKKSIGLSQKYVNIDSLLQNWNLDLEPQPYLIQLMMKQSGNNKKKNKNFIKLSQFLHVISNYISYKVNDIDDTNNLPIEFINYLIYAQEEIIISASRYEKIKEYLCKERQYITLHMWMDYQCNSEQNKFESQLRSIVRYYQLIYQNNSFMQFIAKVDKLVKNNVKRNSSQNQYISQFLQNWLNNPDLYNVGSIELKLKIEQLLSK